MMTRAFALGATLLLLASCASGIGPPSAAESAQLLGLRHEIASVDSELTTAAQANDQLEGGLIKALIEQRIETLRLTRALLSQRVVAIETRAPMTTRIATVSPDTARAARLALELVGVRQQLREKQAESAQYEGGLLKSMIEVSVATLGVTLTTLESERLKALYGIPSPQTVSDGEKGTAGAVASTGDHRALPPKSPPALKSQTQDRASSLLVPLLKNKRFQETDVEQRIYDDAIWFDVQWRATGLAKPARAIKGTLIVSDLFGEPKLRIGWTINQSLSPGETFEERSVGFDYNQFKNEHQWMRSTELSDMTFRFRVSSVIFQDGTREEFAEKGN